MTELLELGKTAIRGGYLDQAGEYYRQAANTPDLAEQGHYGLGLVALKRGEPQRAWQEFRRAEPGLKGDPDFHVNFGTVLRLNRRLQDAVEQFEAALKIDENHALGWAGMGHCLVDNGDTETAARYFFRSVRLNPDQPNVQLALGGCLHKRGDYQAALYCYRKALHDEPASAQARYLLGQTLVQAGRNYEAVHFLEPLHNDATYENGARQLLALAWFAMGRPERVLELVENLQLPAHMEGRFGALKARALNMLGRTDEAMDLCRRLIDRDPSNANAWYDLLEMDRRPLSDEQLEQLRTQQQQADPNVNRGRFSFALATALERAGDYAGEWRALEEGNAVLAAYNFYDPDRADVELRNTLTWDKTRLEDLAAGGDHEFRPIFILGMPRSGTTLVEQVLSSHSEVDAAGESGALSYVVDEYVQTADLDEDDSALVEKLAPDDIAWLAARYRRILEDMDVTANRITEKSINNMKVAGLLYVLFPEARFVVMHRHPLDVAFGCFKQPFNHQAFSFTLEGCAHEYALYHHHALPHLREHLPASLCEIRYEDLVSDQEGVTRALLEHAGLPWEDACLHFQENRRAVATASQNQVREGLFTSAAGRWERYGELLDPLREALRAEGVDV